MINKTAIIGVNVTNETEDKILEYLFERLKKGKEKTFIITPNPEMLVYASHDLAYQDKLNHADIALADGVGLFFASGFLGQPLQERIPGVDFLEEVCKKSRELPLSMGFLGGQDGVAQRTAECLLQKYPYLNIVFAASEWNEKGFQFKNRHGTKQNKTQKDTDRVVQRSVPRSLAIIDILFVAYGVPKQEEWIYERLDSLPVKAAIGVGGAFDFLSGDVHRAPYIVRLSGFEWLFRLVLQPWRWKRQLALLEFTVLVFKQKFSKS